MVLSSLEGFIRMCRSRHEERSVQEDPKGRGVGLEKFLQRGRKEWPCGKAVFPTRGCVKLGMPPTLLPEADGRNMLALSVRGRVGKINIKLLQ